MEKRELILILAVILIILNLINAITIITITGRVVATGIVSVCYNHGPIITSIPNSTAYNKVNFSLKVNASDEDGNNISYYDNTPMFEINLTTGWINFIPNISQKGNYTIQILVNDYDSGCPTNISTTFFLQIINLPPNLTSSIPNQTWEEDVWLTGLTLSNYFSDPENDTLTYSSTYGSHFTITINNNNSVVTFKPEKDWYGESWVVFTANDSDLWTHSNNVTLNITHVANYCGDSICNADESCSNCVADCGTCPPSTVTTIVSGGTGGGGGGGGGSYIEKIISGPKEKAICVFQEKCSEWMPITCFDSGVQKRSCLKVSSNCQVTERTTERPCVCNQQWECTIWMPEECPESKIQERTCLDINNCQKAPPYLLQKECVLELKRKEIQETFNVKSFLAQAAREQLTKMGKYIAKYRVVLMIMIIIVCIISYYFFSYFKNRKVNTSLKKSKR